MKNANENNNTSMNGNEAGNGSAENFVNIDSLLANLRKEDEKQVRNLRNMRVMYLVLIIFYLLLFLVNPDPELLLHHRISGLCYVSAFIYMTLLFRMYRRKYTSIDYSVPAVEMFAQAASRYSWSIPALLSLIPPLALIDAGLTLSFYHRMPGFEPLERILIVQSAYLFVLLLAGIAGFLTWRRRQKPLRDGAMKIVIELTAK